MLAPDPELWGGLDWVVEKINVGGIVSLVLTMLMLIWRSDAHRTIEAFHRRVTFGRG